MLHFTEHTPIIYHTLKSSEDKCVYQLDQLQVKVAQNPIGGYRGQVGTLTIEHVNHKVFTDWDTKELQTLSQLTHLILKIHEEARVNNTLIFARQDNENENHSFQLSLIPYFINFQTLFWLKSRPLYGKFIQHPYLNKI